MSCKWTYSGRWINYLSNYPFQHKIAINKNLCDTAILLSGKFENSNRLYQMMCLLVSVLYTLIGVLFNNDI